MSAALRLRLYQDAYGWTELRLYVLTTIVSLAAALVLMTTLALAGRMQLAGARAGGHRGRGAGRRSISSRRPRSSPRAMSSGSSIRPWSPPGGHAGPRRGLSRRAAGRCRADPGRGAPRAPGRERRAVLAILLDRKAELATDPAFASPAAWNLGRERARASLATLRDLTAGYGRRPARYRLAMALPFEPPLEPMLAKAADNLPSDDGWLFEPKWDGFRALVFRDGDEIYTQSRDLKPLDRYFPELADPLRAALPERCVLDGEVVIARDGALAVRVPAAAHPPGRVAGQDAGRGVAGELRRLGPARARRRGPARRAAGRATGSTWSRSSGRPSRRST